MPQDEAEAYERSGDNCALCQGEILASLVQAKLLIDTVGTERPRVIYETHPFAIILSQGCDLSQDYIKAESETVQRQLPSILFAQMVEAPALKGDIKKTEHWQRVVKNKDERYHFLAAVPPEKDALAEGIPELGIDFKRYFTVPTDEVYKRLAQSTRRRCRLRSPYLEHLNTRFYYYQFRVALPQDHLSV